MCVCFPPSPCRWQRVKHNTLESAYLITSLFILLAGMTFQSRITAVGSRAHYALTYLVAIVLVACVSAFLGVLAQEVWRSLRFAKKVQALRRQSRHSNRHLLSSSSEREQPWMTNPLKRLTSRHTGTSSAAVPGIGRSNVRLGVPRGHAGESDSESSGSTPSQKSVESRAMFSMVAAAKPPAPPPLPPPPTGGPSTSPRTSTDSEREESARVLVANSTRNLNIGSSADSGTTSTATVTATVTAPTRSSTCAARNVRGHRVQLLAVRAFQSAASGPSAVASTATSSASFPSPL
jgi:hypothetical protein